MQEADADINVVGVVVKGDGGDLDIVVRLA